MIKVGIIGTGYWGKHYIRIFSKLKCQLVGIADIDPHKKELADNSNILFFTDYKKLLDLVDAVAIVTPPATHFSIATDALRNKKHVLLEKPFTETILQAKKLKILAIKNKLTLMSGHTYLYNPAISLMRQMINSGKCGQIYYVLMQWLNLGIIRKDVNALWNFGPHPFSILNHLFENKKQKISAIGNACVQKGIEDVVFITAISSPKVVSQINMSWLHPVKTRQVVIVGSKRLLVFNDTEEKNQLKIYDNGIDAGEFAKAHSWNDFVEFKKIGKSTAIGIPSFPVFEPLREELQDFISSIEEKKKPVSDADSAIAVLGMMQMAEKSMKKNT